MKQNIKLVIVALIASAITLGGYSLLSSKNSNTSFIPPQEDTSFIPTNYSSKMVAANAGSWLLLQGGGRWSRAGRCWYRTVSSWGREGGAGDGPRS